MRRVLAVVALGLLWAACSAPLRLAHRLISTPTPSPMPTQEEILSRTPRPSATYKPAASPNAPPTLVLASPASPLPTFAIPTASPTPTAVSALDCKLAWQSPGSGIEFDPSERFTVGWKLTNTGRETWSPGSTEFAYFGGAQLHNDPVVQLKASVPPGQSVILTADMKAPRNSTLYTTYWGLRQGNTFFCRVSLTIYVE